MGGSTFGTILRVTTFGESHSAAIGAVIDGCPAGIPLSINDFDADLAARKPIGIFETKRAEPDMPEILSGILSGVTLGTPIAIIIRNNDTRPHDYKTLKEVYRPGHADFAYDAKYLHRDWRGGGRASGRETAARVVAGTVAKKILSELSEGLPPCIRVGAIEIAGIPCKPIYRNDALPNEVHTALEAIRSAGDSAGAVLQCTVQGLYAGLGEPVFEKLDAVLAQAMLSIGSIKGITFGKGFDLARFTGSHANSSKENAFGGISGGISDGNEIIFQLAIKPVPSISRRQYVRTVSGEETYIGIAGRHDVCLFRRIMPVVEAMTALVLADMLLRQKTATVLAKQ